MDDEAQKALDSGEVCGQPAKCKAKWVFRDDSCRPLDDDNDCVEDSGNHFENRDLCQNYCVTKAAVMAASMPRSLDVSVSDFRLKPSLLLQVCYFRLLLHLSRLLLPPRMIPA